MEEFGYWTGFASGFYLGLSISASLTMIALLGIAAVRNPRRNYGVPRRSAEIVVLDRYRTHA